MDESLTGINVDLEDIKSKRNELCFVSFFFFDTFRVNVYTGINARGLEAVSILDELKNIVYYISGRGKVIARDHYHFKYLIRKRIKKYGPHCSLNDIDTRYITYMGFLFYESDFDGDISEWDVSNVDCMAFMFKGSSFNGDISKWDVSHVRDMGGMFAYSKFDGDISQWDVSNVKDMRCMFFNSEFDGDLSRWNVSKVENMTNMFYNSKFRGDISNWDAHDIDNAGYRSKSD